MSRSSPANEYVAEPNALERRGAAYLQRQNPREQLERRSRTAQELDALRRIERGAVIRAFLAGAISGVILGVAELLVMRGLLEGMADMDWRAQLPWWMGLIGLALLVSGAEILFLYWNAMRSVARVSQLAGVSFTGGAYADLLARGQARAALEFPNPRSPVFGIDPYARVPRWKLTAWSLLYKMKVGLTSFVLRVLLRRVLGRAALRSLIPLVTGPLYAFWNAIITLRIVREGRLRAFGPLLVESVMGQLAGQRDQLRPGARSVLVQAMGEKLVRSQDAHPNVVYLLARLLETLELSGESIELDWAAHRRSLADFSDPEQEACLTLLLLASVLESRVRRAEVALLEEVHQLFGREFRSQSLRRMHARLMNGQLGGEEIARALARHRGGV